MESHVRSLAKAITFRVIATLITVLLVFVFTGSPVISVGVGVLDFVVKLLFYYMHERIWNTLSFGRKTKK